MKHKTSLTTDKRNYMAQRFAALDIACTAPACMHVLSFVWVLMGIFFGRVSRPQTRRYLLILLYSCKAAHAAGESLSYWMHGLLLVCFQGSNSKGIHCSVKDYLS